MYTIMIVDDEDIIREGIVSNIDWQSNGFKIVAEASNGKEALEKAVELKPQVVLTDIYMPIMGGIEFARALKEINHETIIIFLSGYNEFNYAQQAIEIGVFRYLTKPIKEDDLLLVLEEVTKDLEHKELEKEQLSKLNKMIEDNLPLIRERFFLNLVRGYYKESEIFDNLNYFSIDIKNDKYLCMILSLDDYYRLVDENTPYQTSIIKFSIQNALKTSLEEIGGTFYIFEEKRNEIAVIYCFDQDLEDDIMALIYPVLNKVQNSTRSYFSTTVSVGIGLVYDKLPNINLSYQEAEDALEYKTTFGKNSIISISDIKTSNKSMISAKLFDQVNELVKAVRNADLDKSQHILDEIFKEITKSNTVKKDYVHLISFELISKLVKTIIEFDGERNEVLGKKNASLEVLKLDTIEDIRECLLKSINDTIDFINTKRNSVSRNFIEKAKKYIDENYYVERLNLALIAKSVHVSPGYLSQLFKQVSGESCIEYLTKVRINQAKILLKETTLKTYEIADKVGYNDPQYFSACFKKVVGTSPSDYRDKISIDLFDD